MGDSLNITQLKAAVNSVVEQYAQHDLDRELALLEANQRILAQQTQIGDLQGKVDELLSKIKELRPPVDTAPPEIPGLSPVITLKRFGNVIHVHALGGSVADDPFGEYCKWDFGDPDSSHDILWGWNAAHVYDKPGTYTITLEVIDLQNKYKQAKAEVTIDAPAPRVIRVGVTDSDVQTLSQAFATLTDDTAILLQRGQTFEVSQQLLIDKDRVLIDAYGDGPNPVIKAVNWKTDNVIFRMAPTTSDFSVRNITFDSDQTSHTERTATPVCIVASGQGLTVRDCTFLNVDFAVNGNGVPRGVLMQNNHAPLETGIRSCFAWVEGSDWVILGNDVVNVTRQHTIRMQRYDRVLVYDNKLANIDRQDKGDKLDWVKTVFWAMEGQHAYFSNNTTTSGMVRIGPFQEGDKSLRTQWIVLESNNISGNLIEVMVGTEHFWIDNNDLAATNTTAISVAGFSKRFGMGVDDLRITNNDGWNMGSKGKFLAIGAGLSGIVLTNNTYMAAGLSTTAPDYSVITVSDDNVKAFARVSGNLWTTKPVLAPKGTYIYVWPVNEKGEAQWNEKGCWTGAQWNTATGGDDTFVDATKETK